VIKAYNYIDNTVKPWAERKKYILVIGGYSLGGFIAQYVGYQQNLYNISFDGLWGVKNFLPQPLDVNKISKCATLCYSSGSIVSWPQIGIGHRFQINPLGRDAQSHIVSNSRWGCFWHSMAFFYDQLNPPQYSARLSRDDISAMYRVNPSSRDALDLLSLHNAVEDFRSNGTLTGMSCFFQVSEVFRNAVYHQMYLIKKNRHGEVWELGMHCFIPSSHRPHFSSTRQEKVQAIEPVLINRWSQARGL
jgi:hypothetical protein